MLARRIAVGLVVLVGIGTLGWLLSFPIALFSSTAPQHSWVYRGVDQIFYGTRVFFSLMAVLCAIWTLRSAKLRWTHWCVIGLAVLALLYALVLHIQAYSITW